MAEVIDFGGLWSAAALAASQTASKGVADTQALLRWELVFLAALFAGMIWIARRRDRSAPATPPTELALLTQGSQRLGLLAAAVFVLGFSGWSVYAPLASAALAPGVISPDGYRKTVQHLEGGIIRTIHVRESDEVAAGDPLITLDDTAARAQDAEIRERYLHVLAAEARLETEQSNAAEIVFPPELLRADTPDLQEITESQRQLFLSRKATLANRIAILEARVLQLGEQNAGFEQVIAAEGEQLALVDEEITMVETLLAQGLGRKPEVLGLQRTRTQIAASRAMNRARIAENAEAIGEAQLQLIALTEQRSEEVAEELANIRRVISELRAQMPSREDILERTVIRAPISGTVMNLKATTEGGVIRPSEAIAEIVPAKTQLVINARVQPNDIDRIVPGMSARVILTAYNQRNLPIMHGRLQSISADALVDERTGVAYFLAKVEVDPKDLDRNAEVRLLPGMSAEVMLLQGNRSAFDYFLGPILQSRRRSFLEG
ncbi:HlyD family type I secretion periplasmic adaptor subunit [Tabrizicola oligotrophica]|nr:HlyD family type I secretion periplasmic adaptor subunit [Tabrizicola oligotrophica]